MPIIVHPQLIEKLVEGICINHILLKVGLTSNTGIFNGKQIKRLVATFLTPHMVFYNTL